MKTMLSQIDHIIECRDYRIPLTSRNPMFEDSLAGRERMVVYTKKDLGGSKGMVEDTKVGKKTKKITLDHHDGRWYTRPHAK